MRTTWFTLFFLLSAMCIFAQADYCIEHRFSEGYFFDSAQIEFTPDVVYAVAKRWPSTINDSLKMDFFAPRQQDDSLTLRPFILLIHGGAFLAGNKHDMHYQCMEYARRGFVVATMEYRLGWNCTATDLLGVCVLCQGENYKLKTATYRAVQDARAAMRYVYARAENFGIDTAWLFIGGESAGSITALHTAFWSQADADSFASFASGQVGLLDTSGNELPSGYSIKGVIDNCGAVSRDSVVLNNGDISVISFHDENDCVVPTNAGQVISCVCQPFYWAWGSSSIHQIMSHAGQCTEMNLVPLSLNHCSYPTWNLVRHSACFLKRILCGQCNSTFSNNTSAPAYCDTLHSNIADLPNLKLGEEQPLLYYPNPSDGEVTFDLSNYTAAFPLSVKVRNASGEIIAVETGIQTARYRPAFHFPQLGIYLLSFSAADKLVTTAKLVVR